MNTYSRHRVSWGLNFALAAAAVGLLWAKPRPSGATPPASLSRPISPPAGEAEGHVRAADPSRYSATASAAEQRRWLIDQLRAMGVPNHVLARVVLADLDAAWTKYSAAVALKSRGNSDTMSALQLEVDRTRDAEMRAALGEEGFRQWDQENMRREIDRGNVPLSAAETAASYGLWKNLQQRQLELRSARLKGDLDESEVSAALEKAVTQYAGDMKQLLGEDRYAQSQRPDAGPTEAGLRQDLAAAKPSEAQFQELLQTQQQWNNQRAELDLQFKDDPASATYAAQLKALDDARDETYRRVLGTEAFDALQKQQDASYTNMKKHEEIWGLSDSAIDSVYGGLAYYQKSVADYQAQARTLEAQGQQVDWSAVNQNVRKFAEQTQQSLRTLLSADQFNQLQRNGVFTPLAEPLHYARPNGNIDQTNTVSIR